MSTIGNTDYTDYTDYSIPDIEPGENEAVSGVGGVGGVNGSGSGEKDSEAGENVKLILIQLAEAGEIPQSVRYIEKANNKVVRKIYAKYQMMEQDKNNTILSDVLITKFSELMGMLNTVPSGELLAAELREDKLLKRDIKKVIGFISPFIPFIGVITGGATLGKHVMQHQREHSGHSGTTSEQSVAGEEE